MPPPLICKLVMARGSRHLMSVQLMHQSNLRCFLASNYFIYDCFTQTHTQTHIHTMVTLLCTYGPPYLYSWPPISHTHTHAHAHTHHTHTRISSELGGGCPSSWQSRPMGIGGRRLGKRFPLSYLACYWLRSSPAALFNLQLNELIMHIYSPLDNYCQYLLNNFGR